jgi:hypothetical protein
MTYKQLLIGGTLIHTLQNLSLYEMVTIGHRTRVLYFY